jgi:hypothetical protein
MIKLMASLQGFDDGPADEVLKELLIMHARGEGQQVVRLTLITWV